jgi:hypothetical protein
MRDFTLDTYNQLLATMQEGGYSFFKTKDLFLWQEKPKQISLRHDVDKLPKNSLVLARVQNLNGIVGTYYFRAIPTSFNREIILEIDSLGHEIGYHYETMDTCNGNVDKAYNEFCLNLDMFRKIVAVETVCMHGSPLSKYDNRSIWERYDYKKLGIIIEPYIDIDFNKVFYITDTGRMWDGDKVSFRDKPRNQLTTHWPTYHSTFNIIAALKEGTFPDIAMMTFHPQRWTNNSSLWYKELIVQNVKNSIKKILVK